MAAVEPRSRGERDEELRAVGVGPRVGRREHAGARVAPGLALEALVLEARAVDGAAAAPVAAREVAHLRHELRNDAVHHGVLVVELLAVGREAHVAAAERAEVARCDGDGVVEELDLDAAERLCLRAAEPRLRRDVDVEEADRVGLDGGIRGHVLGGGLGGALLAGEGKASTKGKGKTEHFFFFFVEILKRILFKLKYIIKIISKKKLDFCFVIYQFFSSLNLKFKKIIFFFLFLFLHTQNFKNSFFPEQEKFII
jgi:hypothetical protein